MIVPLSIGTTYCSHMSHCKMYEWTRCGCSNHFQQTANVTIVLWTNDRLSMFLAQKVTPLALFDMTSIDVERSSATY